MGSAFRIRCLACDYEARATVGDAEHFIATCPGCRQIVNPKAVPFRLDPPPCPRCQTPVYKGDRWPESCPRCGSAVEYKQLLHFSLIVCDRFPTVGEVVHVWREPPSARRQWTVPQVWLRRGEVVMTGAPEELIVWREDGPVLEAEVTEVVDAPEGHVARVVLSFCRTDPSVQRPAPF